MSIIQRILFAIQAILSAILLIQVKIIPKKFAIWIITLIVIMLAIAFGMQFLKGKGKIVGSFLSAIMSIVLLVGIIGLQKTNYFLEAIGSDGLKVDNMVVAVRVDDSAESIQDTKDYEFGTQTTLDYDNTKKMCIKVEDILEKKIDSKEFVSLEEMVQSLLSCESDAIIYNEAFTDVIEETYSDYSDKIKIIYRYGIETKLEQKESKNVENGFNIYISGIDVSGAISTTSRSDVNIIMTINPSSKHILLTTTPRDYYVPIPGISGGAKDKLTHAGIYGVDASIRTLEELYGIDISYYAKVNFSSLIQIVDILGGVDVYSEYAFTPLHGEGFSFVEGMNHMNGEQALAFARERYSFEAGDNQRGKNQEAVIEAIIKKAMSPAILKNAGKLIESVSDSVQTDMSIDQMTELINMQLNDNANWTIESQAVKGSGDENSCYSSGSQLLYVMNPNMDSVKKAKACIESVLSEE